jgi:crotonobetainyl-CoA:carnitine CoA-transferase CaiB-like acyl-CoA transferase
VLPLEGIRVLDLSRVLAGPYCTMLLADLGADVVKVERPGEGDETRTWGPPYAGGEAAYFLSVNRGKRSIAVDLGKPEGREVVRRLARASDVVLENFRRGTAARLGVGYDELERENPQLVYCSISGFGDRAPTGRPGYDFVLQAESGLMAITGDPDGPPTKVGVAVVDVLTGYAAATSILAALAARTRTGHGAQLEVSLLDTALSALVNVAAAAVVTGAEPRRFGNAHPTSSPIRRSTRPTACSPWRPPTTGSSGVSVTCSGDPSSPTTTVFARTRSGSTTATSSSPSCNARSRRGPRPSGWNGSMSRAFRQARCAACSTHSRPPRDR